VFASLDVVGLSELLRRLRDGEALLFADTTLVAASTPSRVRIADLGEDSFGEARLHPELSSERGDLPKLGKRRRAAILAAAEHDLHLLLDHHLFDHPFCVLERF